MRTALRQTRLRFVNVELDLGLTFAAIAQGAGPDMMKEARCEGLARQAFDTAIAFARNGLSTADRKSVAPKARQLARQLVRLSSSIE